jgi:hypothetical protein
MKAFNTKRIQILLLLLWIQPLAGPNIHIPTLHNAWLDSTRQFLKQCSAHLEIPSIPLPVSQRQHDACIMDSFLGLGLSPPTLQRLDFCCLWLQVTQLWLGIAPMPSSAADWPIQPRPHHTVWGLWRRALSDSVCSKAHRYVMATRPGTLTTPLGAWSSDYDPQGASPWWTSFFSNSTQPLFIPVHNQPAILRQLSTSTRLAFSLACYDLHGPQVCISASDLPPDAVPAQPTTSGSFLRVNQPNTP